MSGSLRGKVAIVTGAAGGIGAATARLFVDEGACVLATDINPPTSAGIQKDTETARYVRHDVTSYADWERVVALAEKEFGRVDILINNAGISGKLTSVVETTVEDYLQVINVNQTSVFLGFVDKA